MGSLLPHKGVHTAVEALGLLQQRGLGHRISFTILGGGHPDYEARLHRMVEELGIGDRVCFAGRVPRSAIPEWMSRFDAFLFTSTWAEPMARSVMEAMAAGLLVIGTEVGGQVEMLTNEENSLTFRAGDAEGLARQIERVLREPALASRLAHAGQRMVLERFSLRRMTEDIERWLESLLS